MIKNFKDIAELSKNLRPLFEEVYTRRKTAFN
jgi:hypothetical protein